MLKSFEIIDDFSIASTGAVEVTVELQNGQRRWCYFMTPQALSRCGDLLSDARTRVHYNTPYMIVVSEINRGIVDEALKLIDEEGELEFCTLIVEKT